MKVAIRYRPYRWLIYTNSLQLTELQLELARHTTGLTLAPSWNLFFLAFPWTCNSHRTCSMPKKVSRPRLLTHHAQLSQQPQHNFVTLSNTSNRVRKVFTASASSSSLVEQEDQPEEDLSDSCQPMIVDDLDGNASGIDYPANISVHTKAKRYENSV